MKTPNLKELKPGAAHQMPTVTPSLRKQEAIRKTFSFFEVHMEYINEVGRQLSEQEGRLVNSSEVLRFIIERDKAMNP